MAAADTPTRETQSTGRYATPGKLPFATMTVLYQRRCCKYESLSYALFDFTQAQHFH